MGTPGHSEAEKIKILYEDSLKDIRDLTRRLETVASQVQNTTMVIHDAEKLTQTMVSETAASFRALADTEMKRAGQQSIGVMASQIEMMARRIAGDSAASERQKSFVWAAGSLTVLSVVMFGAGMTLGSQVGLGAGFLAGISLAIGVAAGLVLFQCLVAGEQVTIPNTSGVNKEVFMWTEDTVKQATEAVGLTSRAAAACSDVLLGQKNIDEAAVLVGMFQNTVRNDVRKCEEWKKNK